MPTFLLCARKDLQRLISEPFTVAVWIGVPLLFALLLVLLFGPKAEIRPRGLLMIADQDKTLLSGLISGVYVQEHIGDMLSVERVGVSDGRARIAKGDGAALLIIPAGFTAAAIDGRKAELTLLTNPAQNIAPQIIQQVTEVLAETGATLRRMLPTEMLSAVQSRTELPVSQQARVDALMNSSMRRIGRLLNPPLIQVKQTQTASGPPFDFAKIMIPSAVFNALMFLAFGLGMDIWKERLYGTLKRTIAAGRGAGSLLAGKTTAFVALALVVGAAGLAGGHYLLDMRVGQPLAALAWIGVSAAGLHLMMMYIQTSASTSRSGNMLANMVLMPLSFVGGSMFPVELLPGSFRAVGAFTPNGWALTQFKALINGGVAASALWRDWAFALAWCAVLFLLLRRRLQREAAL